jgi:hypothetical protein
MTSDEESYEGNSVVKTEVELAMAVEHFHVRKWGTKLEKRGKLKVNNSGVTKKQKTPIKTSMQSALMQLSRNHLKGELKEAKLESGDLMEVTAGDSDVAPKEEPKHLTGTHDEAR